MTNRLLGLLLVAAGLSAASTDAFANLDDFVCRAIPGAGTAVFYDSGNNHFRDCTLPNADPNVGMCQERVECAALTDDARRRVTTSYAHDHHLNADFAYSGIPSADRIRVIEALHLTLSWHPATVSCRGKIVSGPNGGPKCPAPDLCKGDTLIQSRAAAIATAGGDDGARPAIFAPNGAGTPGSGSAQPGPEIDRAFQ